MSEILEKILEMFMKLNLSKICKNFGTISLRFLVSFEKIVMKILRKFCGNCWSKLRKILKPSDEIVKKI